MIRHDPAKGGNEILTHAVLWVKAASINAGECVEKSEPSTLFVGIQTDTTTMENNMEIP